MSNALAIPAKGSPVPVGWAEQTDLELAAIEDIATLDKGASELDGYIAAHKRNGENVAELRRGKLYVETRIGELLGPASAGGNDTRLSHDKDELTDIQRHELRSLAWRDGDPISEETRQAILDGATSRRAVLKEIAASNGTPEPGPRKRQQQERLIGSVANRMDDIRMTIGEIDLSAAKQALPKGKEDEWLSQLRDARTALSTLINALG